MINQHECICEPKGPGYINVRRNMALSSVIYIAVLVYGIASTRGEDAVTLAVSFVVLVALIMIALALIEKFRGKHTFTCSLYRAYSSPAISVFQALKM